ncbi:MAG TPA: aspartate kinase [Anaerolineales bacterium]|nr:aspartate kinase [Anaerolineales bacterium]
MTKKTLVMKFGGTSVGTPSAMDLAAQLIGEASSQWPRLVVVTSAMSGVTNLLLESAANAVLGNPQEYIQAATKLQSMHFAVIQELIAEPKIQAQTYQEIDRLISEFRNLCYAIHVLGEATPRALDAVAGLGERMSVRLLSAVLQEKGFPSQFVEATQLIITDERFQGAHPDLQATQSKTQKILNPILDTGKIPVVTGFIATTISGVQTTLGRGGSDYSAAILGAVLPADEVWIWTDVNGVMSADPRLVPDACTIPVLSYREIAELAYFGAKVLHPKAIRPVIEKGIGLRVCNTFNPQHPGTMIVAENDHQNNGKIKAVTIIQRQSLITIEGRGMLGVPGVAARTFGAVAATGTSVPLITQASSEQSICFAVPSEASARVVQAVETAFKEELDRQDIDKVWASDEVGIITIVGAGMRNTPGISGKIFSALGAKNVNVIAIAQGSTEVAISLVVDAKDSETALIELHKLISCPGK